MCPEHWCSGPHWDHGPLSQSLFSPRMFWIPNWARKCLSGLSTFTWQNVDLGLQSIWSPECRGWQKSPSLKSRRGLSFSMICGEFNFWRERENRNSEPRFYLMEKHSEMLEPEVIKGTFSWMPEQRIVRARLRTDSSILPVSWYSLSIWQFLFSNGLYLDLRWVFVSRLPDTVLGYLWTMTAILSLEQHIWEMALATIQSCSGSPTWPGNVFHPAYCSSYIYMAGKTIPWNGPISPSFKQRRC